MNDHPVIRYRPTKTKVDVGVYSTALANPITIWTDGFEVHDSQVQCTVDNRADVRVDDVLLIKQDIPG